MIIYYEKLHPFKKKSCQLSQETTVGRKYACDPGSLPGTTWVPSSSGVAQVVTYTEGSKQHFYLYLYLFYYLLYHESSIFWETLNIVAGFCFLFGGHTCWRSRLYAQHLLIFALGPLDLMNCPHPTSICAGITGKSNCGGDNYAVKYSGNLKSHSFCLLYRKLPSA